MLRHNRHNKFIPCLSKKFKNWSFLWILIALLGLYAHVIGLWFFFFSPVNPSMSWQFDS